MVRARRTELPKSPLSRAPETFGFREHRPPAVIGLMKWAIFRTVKRGGTAAEAVPAEAVFVFQDPKQERRTNRTGRTIRSGIRSLHRPTTVSISPEGGPRVMVPDGDANRVSE